MQSVLDDMAAKITALTAERDALAAELAALNADYATEVREHQATTEKLRETVAEKRRLRSIVSLAKMLIQPTSVGGPILEGHQKHREALMQAVRGMKYTDPRDAELSRLRTLEAAAIAYRHAYIEVEENEPEALQALFMSARDAEKARNV